TGVTFATGISLVNETRYHASYNAVTWHAASISGPDPIGQIRIACQLDSEHEEFAIRRRCTVTPRPDGGVSLRVRSGARSRRDQPPVRWCVHRGQPGI